MSTFSLLEARNDRPVKVAVIGTDHSGASVATVIEVTASNDAIAACEHHDQVKGIAADAGIMGPYLLFNEDAWPELMSLARMLQPTALPSGVRAAA